MHPYLWFKHLSENYQYIIKDEFSCLTKTDQAFRECIGKSIYKNALVRDLHFKICQPNNLHCPPFRTVLKSLFRIQNRKSETQTKSKRTFTNLMLQKFEKITLCWADERNWRKVLAPTTMSSHDGVRLVAAIILYCGWVILCACALYQVSYESAWGTLSSSRTVRKKCIVKNKWYE